MIRRFMSILLINYDENVAFERDIVIIVPSDEENLYFFFPLLSGTVLLSSFEYFFYHFFNLPIRVQLANIGITVNSGSAETIYPVLLEDYLACFLPIDPLQQSKLFSQDIQVSRVINLFLVQ
jgi:hypothetical protein